MALSNIFNEPRREVAETAAGVVVVGVALSAFGVVDYLVALLIMSAVPEMPLAIAILIGAPIVGSMYPILQLIHLFGEEVCDALERRGVHLRPRERYTEKRN